MNKFEDIRSYDDGEVKDVLEKLVTNEEFLHVLSHLDMGMSVDEMIKIMRSSKGVLDFQRKIVGPFVKSLVEKHAVSLDMSGYKFLDKEKSYTFISNHRDIVLDSAFLDICLMDKDLNTVEIAIGDNLLIKPWIKDLARVNRSFIVKRGLSVREQLNASKELSSYMHYTINEKHNSIWLAQREGRAKDSNDFTQESVLKMLNLGADGSIKENLAEMNIVPLSISYEYDPCDFLKAKEMQLKRDNEGYVKSQVDDLENMFTGLFGYKGRVYYKLSPCISKEIVKIGDNVRKKDVFTDVAKMIDRGVHLNYHIYPSNYIAADMLNNSNEFVDCYSETEMKQFNKYINDKLEKIDIPNKDVAFLKKCMLTMYANPLKNRMIAQGSKR